MYDSCKDAYAKATPTGDKNPHIPKAPHSILKLDAYSFVLIVNRKSPEILVGTGTYKKVVLAWLVNFHQGNSLSIHPIVCAKDICPHKEAIRPYFFESLPRGLAGIEFAKKHNYQTSNGFHKQFHLAKKALCDAYHLGGLPKPPNFNQICKILEDLIKGVLNLCNHSSVHGDLKPSNLLIYYENGVYSSKLCDLNSIRPIGHKLQEQTWAYLSPLHRLELIHEILKFDPNPTIDQLETFYETNIKKIPCTLTYEGMLQSLGLVFSDILFESKKTQGTPEQMELIWRTVEHLIGFKLTPDIATIEDLNRAIDTSLIEIAKRGESPPRPIIELEELARCLAELKKPKPNTEISFLGHDESKEESSLELNGPSDPENLLELRSFLPQTQKLYETPIQQKVYFNHLSAYIKEMNQSIESPFPHSFRRIGPNKFIVMLNRKNPETLVKMGTGTKKKFAWEITAEAGARFIATKIVLCTDLFAEKRVPAKWHMERLSGLSSVECTGERFIFSTSGHLVKGLHIMPGMPVYAHDFIKRSEATPFSQFSKICTEVLIGMAEIHENGLIYGNFKLSKILIFIDPVTGNLSAKISASETCVPTGLTSYQATFYYLSPRLQRKVIETISEKTPGLPIETIADLYTENTGLHNIIITPEDETATAGIVLCELATKMENPFNSASPAQITEFWRILRNLTGGFIPSQGFKKEMNFFKEMFEQINAICPSGTPHLPKITLREAAARMVELCRS